MIRHISRLALMGAMLFPTGVYALGLGEIRVNSALSQPFDAEIELVSPTADELSTLKVTLANNELFARYGLDRPAYLNNFTFRVIPMGGGRSSVHVSSNRAITEPVVSILVEATWARGRILREYTFFLDPPVFVPSQSAAPAPTVEAPSPVPAPEQTPTQGVIERTPAPVTPEPTAEAEPVITQPVAPPPPESETSAVPPPTDAAAPPAPTEPSEPVSPPPPSMVGDTYDVQRNDSLWKIASRLRPGTPREINQTMIALYRANPQAFSGNINRLRSGAVLRVPAQEEIESIDAREASNEVTRQFNEWRPPVEAPVVEEPGQLRLVAPTEPSAEAVAAAAAEAKAAAEAEAKAAQAEQEAARVAAERAAVEEKARADAEAQRLLELKNAEMARMQQEREAQAAAEAAAKAQAEAAAKAEATTPPAETPAAEPAPAEPVAETPAPPAAPPAPVAEEPSLLSTLPWNFILGGLGIVVLIGFWIWNSRRRQADHAMMPSFPTPDGSATMTPADFGDALGGETVTRTRSRAKEAEDFDIPDSIPEAEGTKPLHKIGEPPPSELPRRAAKSADDTLSSETAVHLDQPDALAEADFHMAYGLYDQAADLVKIAIGREPGRRDLKFKLLEICFVWGNQEMFVETARELYESRDQAPAGEWDKVLIMGKQIAPENPLFRGGAAGGDVLDVNLEGGENRVDFDLFSAPEAGGNEPAATLDFELGNTGERSKPNNDLDFLLDSSGSAPVLADDDTREMDANARTQETPTIEMPAMDHDDRSVQTLREKTLQLNPPPARQAPQETTADRTAELSLDDLGLDVSSLEGTGSLEGAGSLELTSALPKDSLTKSLMDDIGDDEMTRIAPAAAIPPRKPSGMEPTMEMPALDMRHPKGEDDEAGDGEDVGVSTIYLEQMETPSGELVDTMGLNKSDETAHMMSPAELDLDLAKLAKELDDAPKGNGKGHDMNATVEHPRPQMDRADMVATAEMPEMEPVTMSEVGTKLDLARAYMDMGDPDGARSILEEVLQEGNSGQRSEAQRLLDSIR
jgi:pilus assembly protein FimV